jgi:hypothetical protein
MNVIDQPALETRNLTKRYRAGRRAALDGVNLVVPAGGIVALVGPNGAVSTLIRCSSVSSTRPAALPRLRDDFSATSRRSATSDTSVSGASWPVLDQEAPGDGVDLPTGLRP